MEIKPGPELDRAVAEAIGWWIDAARPLDWSGSNGVSVEEFWPSRDLNDALAAAEEVGLFKQYGYCEAAGQHVISKTVPVKSWMDTVAHEATPALAICAAILKLKEDAK